MLRQKPTQVLTQKLLKETAIHFYCLFDESRFSDIWTIMELKKLDCVNMWKMSETANLVFQWIFVLNLVKQKFVHVSIVNTVTLLHIKLYKNRPWIT